MKKLLVLLCLMLIGTSVYGQKSYVNLIAYVNTTEGNYMILSGDVPNEMKKVYERSERLFVGDILNMLSNYGFEVELMSGLGSGSTSYQNINFLLSKKSSSTPTSTISKGDVNTDGEINIADVNEVINLILGIVREHPEILEQIKK